MPQVFAVSTAAALTAAFGGLAVPVHGGGGEAGTSIPSSASRARITW
jgi:hypothetical protein